MESWSSKSQDKDFFLGKIVRKAKKAVKKVVKSPIGKASYYNGLNLVYALGTQSFY